MACCGGRPKVLVHAVQAPGQVWCVLCVSQVRELLAGDERANVTQVELQVLEVWDQIYEKWFSKVRMTPVIMIGCLSAPRLKCARSTCIQNMGKMDENYIFLFSLPSSLSLALCIFSLSLCLSVCLLVCLSLSLSCRCKHNNN